MAEDNGKGTPKTAFESIDPALKMPVDSHVYAQQSKMLQSSDRKTKEFANSRGFIPMMREQVAQEILDDPKKGDAILKELEQARIEPIYTKTERKHVEAYKARREAEQGRTV